jgi:membrane associated rhomboid family serine protease
VFQMNEAEQASENGAVIWVESEQQALDWSLVLASQEIGSVLLAPSQETPSWRLVIEMGDMARAQEAIDKFRAENRGWTLRQRLPWSGLLFHWGALFWALSMVLFHAGARWAGPTWTNAGMMDSAAVRGGAWWRLFTAVTLHQDVGHLMANATIGFILLGLAMARFGAGWALLVTYLAGGAGNYLAFLLDPMTHRSLGASGMVMGALGLVAVQSLGVWRDQRSARRLFATGVFAGMLLFILLGTDPRSDVLAHAGGFIGGVLLGAVLLRVPDRWQQSGKANGVTIAVTAALVLWTWHLALRSAELH